MNCYYTAIEGFPLSLFPINCLSGMYCPNFTNSTIPQICLPSTECQLQRLKGTTCSNINGTFGAQGKFEPVICPPGFFCRNPNSIQICTEGHYCLSGSVLPTRCDFLSFCPVGSTTQEPYLGVFVALAVNLTLTFLWIYSWKSTQKGQKFKFKTDQSRDSISATFKASERLKMRWELTNVSFALRSGKVILDDLSLKIRPHRSTCIIGPSGAGKTSLLNILNGTYSSFSGSLEICGKKTDPALYNKIVAVVQQQDSLIEELTAYEMVFFSAKMRSYRASSEESIHKSVENILLALDISCIAYTLIKYLSGGQRRRVTIATELVSTPSALFLDEPTSGLDATIALAMVEVLAELVDLGTTLVAIIHQPRVEIFKKFDDVIMLSAKGQIIYQGSTEGARPFFEKLGFVFEKGVNEVDNMMDIISGKSECFANTGIKSINDLAKKQTIDADILFDQEGDDSFHSNAEKIGISKGASVFTQLWLCHKLSCLQQFRKIREFVLEMMLSTAVGALTALFMNKKLELYIGAIQQPYTLLSPAPDFSSFMQTFFMMGLTIAFCAVPSGVKIFGEEREFYLKNASNGHSSLAYFVAKQVASLYRIFLAAFHYSAAYVLVAKPILPFYTLLPVITLLYYGVFGVCTLVSVVSKRENAMLFAVILSFLSGSLSGYGPTFAQAGSYGASTFYMLSYNFWSCEALFNETIAKYDTIYDSSIVSKLYGYTTGRTSVDLIITLSIGCGWRVIGFVCFVINVQKEKLR